MFSVEYFGKISPKFFQLPSSFIPACVTMIQDKERSHESNHDQGPDDTIDYR